ncbi:MAG: ribosomal protein S18-alanine N-acetyltransferase [Clostridia bacterium]|nr:ribosomal protein S18-alanine N-acetyltransferase [Clostridia bacterium]
MMTNNLKIRKMSLEDLNQVLVLEKACFHVPWTEEAFVSELTSNLLAHYIVLELDEKIVGYGGVWYIVDEGHITNVAIHPDYRQRGLGKMLVQAMIEDASKASIRQMTLEVRASNASAIGLYEKMGFESVGVRPKYYSDNQEDALIMWVSLE